MLDSEVREMYRIIITALDYYKKRSESIVDEFKKLDKPSTEHVLEIFKGDVDLITAQIDKINDTIKKIIDDYERSDGLPAYVKKEEKIVSSALVLYKKDLEEIQKFPKNTGFDFPLPNIDQQISKIEKIMNAIK